MTWRYEPRQAADGSRQEVYIVTFRTEQQNERVGKVFHDLEEAKEEARRIDDAADHTTGAGVVIRRVGE